jgi:hypothetical protein
MKGRVLTASRPHLLNRVVQPWPPPSNLSFDAVRDFVVANGRKHHVEFLVAVNGDGQPIESIKGFRTNTGLSQKLYSALLDSASHLVIHHNHPSGMPLSRWDLAFLAFPGLRTVIAHTSTLEAALTSHATLSAAGREAFDRVIDCFGEFGAFLELFDAFARPFSFDDDVQEQILQGLVAVDEANHCNKLALFSALNRSGLFLIESDFLPPPLFSRADIQDGIDQLAGEIARAYGTEQ